MKSGAAVLTLQTRTVRSLLQESRRLLRRAKATSQTPFLWPSSVATGASAGRLQSFTVLSRLAVAASLSLGLTQTALITLACARTVAWAPRSAPATTARSSHRRSVWSSETLSQKGGSCAAALGAAPGAAWKSCAQRDFGAARGCCASAQEVTLWKWPEQTARQSPEAACQRRTVLSLEEVRRKRPSGELRTQRIVSVWP